MPESATTAAITFLRSTWSESVPRISSQMMVRMPPQVMASDAEAKSKPADWMDAT